MKTKQDEISLLDLWRILVLQKKVLMLTWLLCAIAGVAYVFLATPIYKVESFMLPPSGQNVQALNLQLWSTLSAVGNIDMNSNIEVNKNMQARYKPEEVYTVFLQSLRSRSERRKFYDKYKIAESLGLNDSSDSEAVFEKAFNQRFIVQQNTRKKELDGFSSLTYEGEDPELAALWVNNFVKEVAQSVAQRLVGDVMSQVEGLKQRMEEQIEGKKALARVRRQDRIVALEEAMKIALVANEKQSGGALVNIKDIAVNTEEVPLYMLPPKMLKAEIKVLKERKDDAPFIDGLRDIEEKLAILEQIQIQPEDVRVMTWDQKASVPSVPERPRKNLIVILAMLVGLLLGTMLAFALHVIQGGSVEE